MKNNKILLLFSLILLIMVSLSVVSASDNSILGDSNHTLGENDNSLRISSYSSLKYSLGDSENNDLNDGTDLNGTNLDGSDNSSNGETDSPDLTDNNESNGTGDVSNETDDSENNETNGDNLNETIDFSNRSENLFLVTPENFYIFFDENNVLRELYGGCTLVFEGNFTDMGTIDIAYPYTHIAGRDALFNNTALCLSANDIELANIQMVLDKELSDNDNAAILVLSDNIAINNITLNYTVPEATTGFLVYSEDIGRKLENLSIVNSSFNFTGNNLYGGWDYGIFLDNTDNALIYGNKIDSYLPLRNVDWSFEIFGGISMDAVATIAVQNSNFLRISGNEINTYVNDGAGGYPTLDSLIFYNCKNATIDQNDIYLEDLDSKEGKKNYLYGLDFYFCDDVTIAMNDLQVFTTGGRAGDGTAYPIQINGPANNMKVAFNNITTFNYGPNCGIYSQNHYGETHIDVISNFINVTGLASTHYWALVAGIEVQDTNDRIWNNTIIVTNLGNYSASNNVYGISYTQNTGGNHTYNIQYNNVTTNGRYAVELKGSDSVVTDSIISNNVLNTAVTSGNRAVIVDGNKKNVTIRNNTDGRFKNVLDDSSYPEWLKNFLGNTTVETRDFKWVTGSVSNASNGTGFDNKSGNNTGLDDLGGNDTIGNNTNGTQSLIDGNGTGNGTSNGTQGNSTDVPGPSPGGNGTGNNTDTNSTNQTGPTGPTNPTDPINNTDPNPVNETDPLNNTEPVNNTDPVNSTEPVNNTEPVNETEDINKTEPQPVNNTDPLPEIPDKPINNTDPVNDTEITNQTNITEPVNDTEQVNTTEPINQTNNTETIENNTNQTILEDDDLDPKESHDNPDDEETPSDDENSNPGDSDNELTESEKPANQNEPNQESENSADSSESQDLSSSTVGDSRSDSASSPGLSGSSAANDAYELDKTVKEVMTKSVDYVSLAGICIAALLLILVGYKRQKDIEDED